MGWLSNLLGGGTTPADAAAHKARSDAWEAALARDRVPPFIEQRLTDAAAHKAPWLSTMTPAELALSRTHGVRPIATVTGTCWYQTQRSWTEGHAQGWASALNRIRAEARVCGANAVVDVKLRTITGAMGTSMDFTLVGTAVRIKDLPPSADPVISTVSAIEFMRLLEAGIVPTGIAVGACYEWLTDYNRTLGGGWTWNNQPLTQLGQFWENVRRTAHAQLRAHANLQGNGVLAHTQFGQILKIERERQPNQFLGRHIVIGTVVEVELWAGMPHDITTVIDLRDDISPLITQRSKSNNLYKTNEREGGI